MDKCERYQKMISAMVDGELSEEQRQELEAHLAVCPDCQALLRAFTALSDELRMPVSVPDDLCASVMARAAAPRPVHFAWRRWGTLAACLVLVGAAALRLTPVGEVLNTSPTATVMGELRTATAQTAPEVQAPEAAAYGSSADSFSLAPSMDAEGDAVEEAGDVDSGYVCAVLSDVQNLAPAALNCGGASYTAPEDETEELLLNLSYAGSAEAPEEQPDYTLELATGSYVELWETGDGFICCLDGVTFVPAGEHDEILRLLDAITE